MIGTARKRITLLGSTGSIGTSALAVVDEVSDKFEIFALVAGSDWQALAKQAVLFAPQYVAIADPEAYAPLKAALAHLPIHISAGADAIVEVAALPCDLVIGAIVGAAGIASAMAALKAGNTLALANKESMVCAGPSLCKIAAENNTRILPIDSEHNAVFQAMEDGRFLDSITITASGGPFLNAGLDELRHVTPAMATQHPKWSMGPKNSLDSATMMNKALELAEAAYLFDLPHTKIDVLIHPQALIHGMAHFCDGTTLAHLAEPDMRIPIAHTMAWPDRIGLNVPRLNLAKAGALEFMPVDPIRFPAIDLMRSALDLGPAGPIVFNAANEIAVAHFLSKQCQFTDIIRCVNETLETFNFPYDACDVKSCLDLDEISAIDRNAREISARFLSD